ncbi:MAG: ABC transporter substrate-binding protein [Acidobacteriota bacterium]
MTKGSRVGAVLVGASLLAVGILSLTCRPAFDQQAWFKAAKLGPFRDKSETVATVEAAARKEGEVVVWSLSSRLEETGKAFEKKYGIKCSVQSMGTQDLLKKVRYDQQAKGFNADVYLFGDAPEVLSTLVKQGQAWPWLSPEMERAIPESLKVGLPAHHVSAIGVIYNSDKYAQPPIKSWWDLTTPPWQGRVVMKDLKKGGGDVNLFSAFVQHSDDLARDYKDHFGEEIKLDGTPNAGYEFLKRLLANKPIFTPSGSEAADKVGASNVVDPPVGLMTLGKVRYKGERSLALKWIPGMTPASGLAYPDPIGVANGAKHPYAAKLFIEYALSVEGYKPYLEYGTWPARTDVPLPEEMIPLSQAGFWIVDPDYNFKVRKDIFDFIVGQQ